MSKVDNVLKNRLLMKDAEEARDAITRKQKREISKLYSDWAKEVGERAEYFKNKTVFIDSFKGFTGQQYKNITNITIFC